MSMSRQPLRSVSGSVVLLDQGLCTVPKKWWKPIIQAPVKCRDDRFAVISTETQLRGRDTEGF